MGAALTYARRYALFTLVGIAGEDDLDAPDLVTGPPPTRAGSGNGNGQQHPTEAAETERAGASSASAEPRRRIGSDADRFRPQSASGLQRQLSAVLRDQLLAELASIGSCDEGAGWAHKRIAAKNSLSASDSVLIEEAFVRRLAEVGATAEAVPSPADPAIGLAPDTGQEVGASAKVTAELTTLSPRDTAPPAWLGSADPDPIADPHGIDKSALPIGAPRRFRDKAHLAFVASQSCLVCGRRPVDPHHVRFAQKQSLGRKVSDEFTIPLCRSHHRELHRSGSEYLWWENVGIDPIKAARKLWRKTRMKRQARSPMGGESHAAPA